MTIKKAFKTLLIKLLKNDPEIKELIHEIAKSVAPLKTAATPLKHSAKNDLPDSQPIKTTDTLRQQLNNDLKLLNVLNADETLQNNWLGVKPTTEGEHLRQLYAVAAQWERILTLWDFIAQRCKDQQRSATPHEQGLLNASVAIHNLIWTDKTASVCNAEINRSYDYEQHLRVNAKGDKVSEQCLTGLINAAGKLQRKPLVKTQ